MTRKARAWFQGREQPKKPLMVPSSSPVKWHPPNGPSTICQESYNQCYLILSQLHGFAFASHRVTESQNGRGWKGPLGII